MKTLRIVWGCTWFLCVWIQCMYVGASVLRYYLCIHWYTCTHTLWPFLAYSMQTAYNKHRYMHECTYLYISCTCISSSVSVYIHIYTEPYIYIYIYIYIYVYTCIHIYIYIQNQDMEHAVASTYKEHLVHTSMRVQASMYINIEENIEVHMAKHWLKTPQDACARAWSVECMQDRGAN
jgi:hypothetical protein